jgi:RND family efflux transporter MFP subunit
MKRTSFLPWLISFGPAATVALTISCALLGCDSQPALQTPVAASQTSDPMRMPAPAAAVALRQFSTSGPLVAEQQADIAAQRDGRVVKVTVDIGDRVRSGQIMAILDDRSLHAACDEEKASVASLQAQIKEWQSQQQVDEADLRRADALRSERILSEEDWEHVKYKLAETVSEVARYKADEAGAEAKLQAANLQLAQSEIVAPFAGIVGRRSLRMAQEVKAGDVLFWITAAAPLHVLFTVPESTMREFERGAALEFTTADYPELRQKGRVYRVSPVVDPASGSVQVIGEVTDPSPLLKPGMTMQVRTSGEASDVVAQVQ